MDTDTKVGHTPGPWTLAGEGRTFSDTPNGAFGVNESTGYPLVQVIGRIGAPKEQAEADASLIAAAPDLLALAHTFKEAIEHMQLHDRLPDDTCPADLYDFAVAAITRAEGRQ